MNYHIKENADTVEVVELGTDLVVTTRKSKDEARDLVRSLNHGAGFDGFTPTFFTLYYPLHAKRNTAQT